MKYCIQAVTIGIGEGVRGARAPPQKKNSGKYFLGNYYVKFGHFGGKKIMRKSEILLTFVNFLGKYKNLGILLIFRAKMLCPLKLTAPMLMAVTQ